MTQDKMRKMITAITAAVTLLVVILLSVLIYQWIARAVNDKKIADLEAENARLEQIINDKNMDAEYYESVIGKEILAIQNGFVRPQGE